MICKNLVQLEKELNKRINNALNDDVVYETVKNQMIATTYEEVYDVYSPKKYKRRGENGGLLDENNIVKTLNRKTHTLKLKNITRGNEKFTPTDGYLAGIIEKGQGYHYKFDYNGKPRPFIQKTIENLKNNKLHIHALRIGLKNQNLNVK